jgi:endonuclease YncB( thermonuclease family)/flagellar motor protein MotB
MHKGIAGEIEHRRGLVLGLTLAEALLLLLFLLLLALGSELDEVEREMEAVKAERDSYVKTASEIETGSIQELDFSQLQVLVATLRASNATLSAKNTELASQLRGIQIAVKDPEKIAKLAKDASAINPDDPPAVLERGLEWVKVKGMTSDPQKGTAPEPPKPASDGRHNWPPIIRLSEAKGYFFASGSAELTPKFKDALEGGIVTRLLEIIKEYDVNVIEVIGHTDEQPLVLRPSNLDKGTSPYLQGKSDIPLVSADNAGLGFARAVSVVRVLDADQRLDKLSVLPLSGAQVIDVGDRLSKEGAPTPAETRRRIEIRVRRSDDLAAAASPNDGWQSTTEPEPHTVPITGKPMVVDADTIEIGGTRIRLWGVDAIESGQLCSRDGQTWDCAAESTAGLVAFIAGKTLTCAKQSIDQYHRVVAKCSAYNIDLGSWLVASGFAMDYPEYSSGAYATEQASASTEKKGIWQGMFIAPSEWRRSHRKE